MGIISAKEQESWIIRGRVVCQEKVEKKCIDAGFLPILGKPKHTGSAHFFITDLPIIWAKQ
jgi:hypothetical protein